MKGAKKVFFSAYVSVARLLTAEFDKTARPTSQLACRVPSCHHSQSQALPFVMMMHSVLRCTIIMVASCTAVVSIPRAPRVWGATHIARSLEERAFKGMGMVRDGRLPPATQARLPQASELPAPSLSTALAVRGGGDGCSPHLPIVDCWLEDS